MMTRMVRGTANQQGRNIFIHPGNSSMREVSYWRIRLGGDQRQVSFANEGQETGLICLQGKCDAPSFGLQLVYVDEISAAKVEVECAMVMLCFCRRDTIRTSLYLVQL